MKRVLLTLFLITITLSPGLIQACTIAPPVKVTLYHSAPSVIPESGSCLDEGCKFTIYNDEYSAGIIETKRYKEVRDRSRNEGSVIWISKDFEEYELSNRGESELSIKEFIDMLEILLSKRILSDKEMFFVEDAVEMDGENRTEIVDSDFRGYHFMESPNEFGCPIVSVSSTDSNEIYSYDYSTCEIDWSGGMCPIWIKKSAEEDIKEIPKNVIATSIEFIEYYTITYPYIAVGVAILSIVLVIRTGKRLGKAKTQRAKSGQSSQ